MNSHGRVVILPSTPHGPAIDDDPIVVPSRLVPWLIGALVRDIRAAGQRGRRERISLDVVNFLEALQGAELSEHSASGSENGRAGTVEGGEILSVAQCAELLECSTRAVRNACSEGRLTAQKHGQTWLIR